MPRIVNSIYHKEQSVLVAITKNKTMPLILIPSNLFIPWLKDVDIPLIFQLACNLDFLISSLLQDIEELIKRFKFLSIHHEPMEVDGTYGSLETTQPTQTRSSTQTEFRIPATNSIPEWKKPTKIKVVVTVECHQVKEMTLKLTSKYDFCFPVCFS